MKKPIPLSRESSDNRGAVQSALASFRMEGLEPDPETAAILEHYATGDTTTEEMGSSVEAHVKRMNVGRDSRVA